MLHIEDHRPPKKMITDPNRSLFLLIFFCYPYCSINNVISHLPLNMLLFARYSWFQPFPCFTFLFPSQLLYMYTADTLKAESSFRFFLIIIFSVFSLMIKRVVYARVTLVVGSLPCALVALLLHRRSSLTVTPSRDKKQSEPLLYFCF